MSYDLSKGYNAQALREIGGRLARHINRLPEKYWDDAIDMLIDVACQEIAIGIANKQPMLSDFARQEQYILFAPEELAEIKTHIRNEAMACRAKLGAPNLFIDPSGKIRI